MRARMIAFCLAVMGCGLLPVLPAVPVFVLFLCAIPCLLLSCYRYTPLALVGAFLLGLSWGVGSGLYRLDNLLPTALEGHDFWVSGRLSSLPQRNGRGQQFAFHIEQSCFDLLPSDCPAQQSFFAHRRILLNYYGAATLAPGQRWQWRVRLNRPHGFANPGSFDYEAWLLMQGYAARGYVRDTPFNVLLPERGGQGITVWRYRLREALLPLLQDLPHRGTLLALIMGDREQVSQEHWALFTATGTNHLIVISGLHVGFIAMLCFRLANFLLRLWPALLLRFPAQKGAALAAIAGALAYSLLAGFSLPTQRALIMVTVFMCGRLFAKEWPVSFSYCLALTLVLLSNPLSVLGAGFWLSFGAVGSLLLAFAGRQTLRQARNEEDVAHGLWRDRQWRRRLWQWVRPQGSVFVGMSVPLLVWTQQLSLLAPAANLIAIPVVSLLVVPLALGAAALLPFSEPLAILSLRLADALLELLMLLFRMLANGHLPGAIWQSGARGPVSVCFALLGSLLFLLPPGWPGRWLSPLFFAPMLWPVQHSLPFGQAQLTVLDVGQGLAIVVRTSTHTLLYDTGPAFSEDFDAGSGIVLPFLRQQGITRLDRIVVSHGDNDHSGGLASVRQLLPVDSVLLSMPLPLPDFAQHCEQGQQWQWDGVRFDMLSPLSAEVYAGNDSSCVLRIQAAEQVALLTGDIERGAEARLLAATPTLLRSHLLIAPHHGSATSSSPGFLEAVAAATVVFSAGYRSQFGHPAPAVVARYGARETRTWNTAISGALTFTLGDLAAPWRAEIAQPYRSAHRRYWYLPASRETQRLHGVCGASCD